MGGLDTNSPSESFDALLLELNDFGPYQIWTVCLLSLASSFMSAWQFFDLVFLLYSPDKSCVSWNYGSSDEVRSILGLANGSTTIVDECELEGRSIGNGSFVLHCLNWTHDTQYFENTLATQWGFCRDQLLFTNIMAVFELCGIFGLTVMSVVQDSIGRKPTFFINLTLALCGCGFSLLATSLPVWFAIRLLQALQGTTSYNLPFVWAQEFVGARKRTLVNFLIGTSYAVATTTLGLVAWLARDWRTLGMWTVFPFVFFYTYVFLVDESPRWLLSVGKVDRATKIVEKMAKWNKRESELPKIRAHLQQIVEHTAKENQLAAEQQLSSTSSKSSRFRMFDLFRFPRLRAKFLLLTAVWTANSLVYCTIAFNAPNLGNFFLAYILQASVELPACLFNLLVSNRLGRMPPIIGSMACCAFFLFMCIPAYVHEWNGWSLMAFAAMAKFAVCIAYNILYQATGELYPTTVRATGLGLNNVAADAVIGVMPYVLNTATTARWMPTLIMGVVMSTGAVACCLLPEPMGHGMPQVAVEAEEDERRVGLGNVKTHVMNTIGKCGRRRSVRFTVD